MEPSEVKAADAVQAVNCSAVSDATSGSASYSDIEHEVILSWWCDLAGEGCLRPCERHDYSLDDVGWVHGDYMVCEVCRQCGDVLYPDKLELITDMGEYLRCLVSCRLDLAS